MACKKQTDLSNKIKTVHSTLRKETKLFGADTAWRKHCQNSQLLKEYATCMRELAKDYWDKNGKVVNSKAHCRFQWIVSYCKEYFCNGLKQYQRSRECRILNEITASKDCAITITESDNVEPPISWPNLTGPQTDDVVLSDEPSKLNLLDVGSCYNPLQNYNSIFDVLAIDLCPATESVKTCDFLQVNTTEEPCQIENNVVKSLQIGYYDVVVFSLLLEYLPSSEQRIICVKKAYDLLKPEGLLIIITPDSNHVGSNARLMKSWRFALACMGFMRIKYEKYPHIHCLSFRKALYEDVAKRWAQLCCKDSFDGSIHIPQDFNNLVVGFSKKGS